MRVQTSEYLPKMAWYLTADGHEVAALIGSKVATADNEWLYEGGWAYATHPKEASNNGVYLGSGVVDHGGASVTLIGPSHSAEALYVSVAGGTTRASNSLALLLAGTGVGQMDANQLAQKLRTVAKGLIEYEREIYRDATAVVYRYVNANVRIAGDGSISEHRQSNPVEFSTYDEYVDFLTTVIKSVSDTSGATGYTVPLSKGYDSVACAALAAKLGGGACLSVDTARDRTDDDGREIGALLGLDTHLIERPERNTRTTKVSYAMFGGVEHHDVIADDEIEALTDYYSGFGLSDEVLRIPEELAAGKVLLTGFHGDRAWGSYRSNPDIIRGDTSGTGLIERRLKAGMVHVPVPMLGVQAHPTLRQLTYSEEMRPWRVGGNYDRPIPRRMAEEMGVARGMFGVKKAAVATVAANRADIMPQLLARQLADYADILARSHN